MAQLFGILPVSGIRRPSPLHLKFVRFSLRTAYSVFINVSVLFMAILSVIHMIRTLNSTTFEVQGKKYVTLCASIQKIIYVFLSHSEAKIMMRRKINS